jgi:hypothetical protein
VNKDDQQSLRGDPETEPRLEGHVVLMRRMSLLVVERTPEPAG